MKRAVYLISIMMLSVAFTGCSGNSNATENTTAPPTLINPEKTNSQSQDEQASREETAITGNITWRAQYKPLGMFREDMVLSQSVNNGKTWTLVTSSDQEGNTIPGGVKSFTFSDANTGWIVTNGPFEGKIGAYKSTDGGKSWFDLNLPVPDELKSSNIKAFLPRFLNKNICVIMTAPDEENPESLKGLFYVSMDGGVKWSLIFNQKEGTKNNLHWKIDKNNSYSFIIGQEKWEFTGDQWLSQ
ncbi:hypothetical protein [Paenibacillus sp. Y412MC10]|uniref:WD40/YVTN/BNR-like repeat-containing protein n=1 Tax=Geobacillus sp. (strain Y412MC10) TaxID=481743 RepID=UPI0011AB64CD|nr:hypothetical protein [Paenibacillus sp. Y412MC10]